MSSTKIQGSIISSRVESNEIEAISTFPPAQRPTNVSPNVWNCGPSSKLSRGSWSFLPQNASHPELIFQHWYLSRHEKVLHPPSYEHGICTKPRSLRDHLTTKYVLDCTFLNNEHSNNPTIGLTSHRSCSRFHSVMPIPSSHLTDKEWSRK